MRTSVGHYNETHSSRTAPQLTWPCHVCRAWCKRHRKETKGSRLYQDWFDEYCINHVSGCFKTPSCQNYAHFYTEDELTVLEAQQRWCKCVALYIIYSSHVVVDKYADAAKSAHPSLDIEAIVHRHDYRSAPESWGYSDRLTEDMSSDLGQSNRP